MSTTSTPRSARFDLPSAPTHASSAATDTALAEWTNRIRAMQRQVDADDEAEQRRLEEEIVRARLARMRRSKTGQSGDFGVGMHGIDLSKFQDGAQGDLGTSAPEKATVATAALPRSAIKSGGEKSAPISLAAFMGGNATGPRLKRQEPQQDASLAYDGRTDHGLVHPVFGRGGIAMPGMVGRDVAAPAAAPPSPPSSVSTSVSQLPPSNSTLSSETPRARTLSTSNVARRYVEKLEEQASSQPSSPKPSGLGIRERRQSTTPYGSLSELKAASTPSLSSRPLSQGGAVPPVKNPVIESRPKTPSVTDTRSKTPTVSEVRPKTPMADYRPKTAPIISEAHSKTPSTEIPIKISIDEPRAKPPGTDTTRAKTPIQLSPTRASFPGALPWQTPRHQPSPQLPSTSAIPPRSPGPPSPIRGTHAPQPQRGISPSFLRPPTGSSAKDPTPSISRLQGRGFVQSIVQASDRINIDTQGSPSAAPRQIFPTSSPVPSQGGSEVREKGARRASVLDRWTPVMHGSGGGTPSPPLKNATPTRSHTPLAGGKPAHAYAQDVPMVKTHDTGRSVRSAVSLPAIPKTPLKKSDGLPAQDGGEKLGSSSTMISYIKPVKTGDDPVVPDVDELGVRASEGGGSLVGTGVGTGAGESGVNHVTGAGVGTPGKAKTPRASTSPLPASPGKPLSHPTKDRARKPRKARFEEDAAAGTSVTGTEAASQPPHPSSTGPASSPDTSSAPAVFGTGASRSSSPPSTGKVTDRWTEPTLIGVKPMSSVAASRAAAGAKPVGAVGMTGRRALPGLANSNAVADGRPVVKDRDRDKDKDKEQRGASPARHTRIPSTGNRALVMDVAQAMSEAAQQQPQGKQDENEKEMGRVNEGKENPTVSVSVPASTQASSAGLGNGTRRSSYERYSVIAMPSLAEERSPAVTPAGTMSRNAGGNVSGKAASVSERASSSLRIHDASARAAVRTPSPTPSTKVHIEHVDDPLPKVDVVALLNVARPAVFVPDPDLRAVSVEVMSVVHTSAVPVQRDANIFYDAEVLVLVYRAKSRESGLVATKVWCWKGTKCHFEEREEKKVCELAKRYGTMVDVVNQWREPSELVYVLGGQLVIRQGSRAHWSSENTAMHIVRSNDGHILIDEIDLSIRNLCSGYSYCVSILDNIYVWHGCGSVAAERTAAFRYAQGMAAKGTSVKELSEGENDGDDEMFWMVVGDSNSYARADYWRWRGSVVPSEPRCWLVNVTNLEAPIRPVPTVFAETMQQGSVYIIDCFWEFFVLVGKDARAKRSDIALAINTAMAMAPLVAAAKPFSPTVHVLILPTQLPLDMRHAFRNLDELTLNGGSVPDHMNILSTTEAIEHLRTSLWDISALRDHTMLPLGLDSSHVLLP